jgi:hypothetical protein
MAQLPGPGETYLDHVAHFVGDIAAAAAALSACGFRLTPFTAQTNREGGATVPSGTGNRCAMLRSGYLELLTATAETPLAQQLRERLAHHTGLHLAAFSTADAAAEHRRLAAAGFRTLPLVDMRRPVGDDFARFTIARIAHGGMPEGRTQFLTHHSERLVWPADMLDHPNGAVALAALWVAADDPAEAAARFARFTGRAAEGGGDCVAIRLDRGALRIATPRHLAGLGIVPGGALPCFAATTVAVADLARLRDCLQRGGIAHRPVRLDGAEAVAATLPPTLGDAILFRAA